MARSVKGNPALRWFDENPRCRCGKPSNGILRGIRNDSYGYRCNPCAKKELAAAEKARQNMEQKP